MYLRRNTLVIKLLSLLLAVSCLVSGTAMAAVQEPMQPLASDYLDTYGAYISTLGDGKFRVCFSVTSDYIMDELGALSIEVYESSDQVNWHKQKTYDGYEYVAMIGENSYSHSGYVTFYGVAGRYYKAYVCIFASKNGGSDSHYFWTSVKQAT